MAFKSKSMKNSKATCYVSEWTYLGKSAYAVVQHGLSGHGEQVAHAVVHLAILDDLVDVHQERLPGVVHLVSQVL